MTDLNIAGFDPFADTNESVGNDKESLIHIRIKQRNGRKTLTTVQGLDQKYDFKKIVKAAKKEFACNGTVVEHPEYGEVIQLQGDQRENIKSFFYRSWYCLPKQHQASWFLR
ncbi:protein translation factor SUI1 homolog [Elysia marginata]|uniref:Protein translation factor SUI1 homolog n=1 Tax=Elysia marginata TaxID=1093978 RepID=A0AAV4J280_9GAST|nr:protein translation factor SUI1 homolog [Elysia marginata]